MNKKAVIFWFFILAGIVCGSFFASICKDISFLSWLAYSTSIGSSQPIDHDLVVLNLTLGLEISVSISHIIFLIVAMLLCPKVMKTIEK